MMLVDSFMLFVDGIVFDGGLLRKDGDLMVDSVVVGILRKSAMLRK